MAQVGLDRELLAVQGDYRVRRRQGEIYARAEADFGHKSINCVYDSGNYRRADEQIYRDSYPSRDFFEREAGEDLRDNKHREERRREQDRRLERRRDCDYRAETCRLDEHRVVNKRAAEQRVGE